MKVNLQIRETPPRPVRDLMRRISWKDLKGMRGLLRRQKADAMVLSFYSPDLVALKKRFQMYPGTCWTEAESQRMALLLYLNALKVTATETGDEVVSQLAEVIGNPDTEIADSDKRTLLSTLRKHTATNEYKAVMVRLKQEVDSYLYKLFYNPHEGRRPLASEAVEDILNNLGWDAT